MKNLNVVAIPGSLRANSSSHKIINIISSLVPAGTDYTVYDGVGRLPHFDDHQTLYPEVTKFREILAGADAVLICTPEYAFGVPGSLKNALDWTVASGEFVNKPVGLITASSQGEHAHAAMKLILTAINSKLLEEATLLIPFIRSKFDAAGELKDQALESDLRRVVDILLAAVGGIVNR
jgi:chromate reductase, NAD(P)H dehydrogenase (quinone)